MSVCLRRAFTYNLLLACSDVRCERYGYSRLKERVLYVCLFVWSRLSVCLSEGPVFVLDEIVDYLENNPQTVAIQDVQCCEFCRSITAHIWRVQWDL